MNCGLEPLLISDWQVDSICVVKDVERAVTRHLIDRSDPKVLSIQLKVCSVYVCGSRFLFQLNFRTYGAISQKLGDSFNTIAKMALRMLV